MILKTRASLAGRVSEAVKASHPYTTPAILVLPLESVEPDLSALAVGGDRAGRPNNQARQQAGPD